MIYTDEFYIKQYREVAQMTKFLQECRFSGSFETKLDLGNVIRLLANQDMAIRQLREELKSKINDNRILTEKLKATTPV